MRFICKDFWSLLTMATILSIIGNNYYIYFQDFSDYLCMICKLVYKCI